MLNKKKNIIAIVAGLLITVAIYFIIERIPGIGNNTTVLQMYYLDQANNKGILILYQQTSYSKTTSTDLDGYSLHLVDPVSGKTIDKFFLKLYSDDVPSPPSFICTSKNEIWLYKPHENIAGDKGYIKLITVNNNKFTQQEAGVPEAYTIQGPKGESHILCTDAYNEIHCFDLLTHKMSDAECPDIDEWGMARKSAFFWIRNQPGSTRAHLYYYHINADYDEPGIVTTNTTTDAPGDGTQGNWHLVEEINMGRGYITEEVLDAYSAKFDSTEFVHEVYTKDFLVNGSIIYEDDERCIVTTGDGSRDMYLFTNTGKVVWKIDASQLLQANNYREYTCQYTEEVTYISNNASWMVAVNNSSGKVLWTYKK